MQACIASQYFFTLEVPVLEKKFLENQFPIPKKTFR